MVNIKDTILHRPPLNIRWGDAAFKKLDLVFIALEVEGALFSIHAKISTISIMEKIMEMKIHLGN
jgi:hypothetical protein